MVKCVLGPSAIAQKKLQHGNPLPVLGIRVGLSYGGITLIPELEKILKYRQQIEDALYSKRLPGGEVSKLAGLHLARASARWACI